ncbi:DnaJ domain-containing protein [Acidovorax sp. sif1233]|uniref:DnaJ domain-containing protein n=1 Tax=Acidovorax sp. sif1233 TaxID=2854792 RepID=UPI001C48084A|nr:DnaJ domain-containing protein [Acidovorax sp. sif1233]MBV7457358.1 DnaJ domain-containing protein [Acidovorax sp. sif1233]
MSPPDHYATLGVARDANHAEIVRAYRRAASHAHPDRGGSKERMQALNMAKDVLTDPERRARYDAGEDDTRQAAEDKARTLILKLFAEAIEQDAIDPVKGVRAALNTGIAEVAVKMRALSRAIVRLGAQRNRVTAKTERNVFKELLDAAIASSEASIRKLEDTRETAQRAMDILAAEYESGPGATPRSPDFSDSLAYGLSVPGSAFRPNWREF